MTQEVSHNGIDHGVGYPMWLSVRGKSTCAPEKRGVRGLRHHAECPQVADTVIEAQCGSCEGAFDALGLLAAGMPRIVAIGGVQGWR